MGLGVIFDHDIIMTSNSGCYTYTVSRMVYSLGLRGFRGFNNFRVLYCIDLEGFIVGFRG